MVLFVSSCHGKKTVFYQWFLLLALGFGGFNNLASANPKTKELQKIEHLFRKISSVQPILQYYLRHSWDLRTKMNDFSSLPKTLNKFLLADAYLADMNQLLERNTKRMRRYRAAIEDFKTDTSSQEQLILPTSFDRLDELDLAPYLDDRFDKLEYDLGLGAKEAWADANLALGDWHEIRRLYVEISSLSVLSK